MYSYECRKWTLSVIIMLNIVGLIVVMLLVVVANDKVTETMKRTNEWNGVKVKDQHEMEELELGWQFLRGLLIVSGVIAGVVQLSGLIVVLKEHYHLVMAYAIIMVISALMSLVASFVVAKIFGMLFSFNAAAAGWAFMMASQIKRNRAVQHIMGDPGINVTHPIVVMCPGQCQTALPDQSQVIRMESVTCDENGQPHGQQYGQQFGQQYGCQYGQQPPPYNLNASELTKNNFY